MEGVVHHELEHADAGQDVVDDDHEDAHPEPARGAVLEADDDGLQARELAVLRQSVEQTEELQRERDL